MARAVLLLVNFDSPDDIPKMLDWIKGEVAKDLKIMGDSANCIAQESIDGRLLQWEFDVWQTRKAEVYMSDVVRQIREDSLAGVES